MLSLPHFTYEEYRFGEINELHQLGSESKFNLGLHDSKVQSFKPLCFKLSEHYYPLLETELSLVETFVVPMEPETE